MHDIANLLPGSRRNFQIPLFFNSFQQYREVFRFQQRKGRWMEKYDYPYWRVGVRHNLLTIFYQPCSYAIPVLLPGSAFISAVKPGFSCFLRASIFSALYTFGSSEPCLRLDKKPE
ncbi:hypothetical protein ACVQK1_07040 [Edwardsiella tarda]